MGRMRYTKVYPDGTVTLDGSQFSVNQEVIDSNIRNSMPIKAAVERLKELEDRDEPRKPIVSVNNEDIKVGAVMWRKGVKIYRCASCKSPWPISRTSKHCPHCGQALDWSEA